MVQAWCKPRFAGPVPEHIRLKAYTFAGKNFLLAVRQQVASDFHGDGLLHLRGVRHTLFEKRRRKICALHFAARPATQLNCDRTAYFPVKRRHVPLLLANLVPQVSNGTAAIRNAGVSQQLRHCFARQAIQ